MFYFLCIERFRVFISVSRLEGHLSSVFHFHNLLFNNFTVTILKAASSLNLRALPAMVTRGPVYLNREPV
jgi:hypothetical protein